MKNNQHKIDVARLEGFDAAHHQASKLFECIKASFQVVLGTLATLKVSLWN